MLPFVKQNCTNVSRKSRRKNVPACAAEVYSSNIVGYTKITVPENKMDIVGVQFQNIGAEGTLSLQDIKVDGYEGYGSDWIRIYDPVTYRYTTAIYWGEDMGGVLDDEGNELGAGWGDEDQVAIDANLSAGTAVWTQSEAGGNLITSGEVVSGNTVVVPENKMTLVANPLPMAVSIQDITVDGYEGYGSDWIRIYDPVTYRYTTAIYWGEDMGGVLDDEGNELGAGWGDEDQVAVDLTIAPGQGFWTQSEAGGSLVFPAISAE